MDVKTQAVAFVVYWASALTSATEDTHVLQRLVQNNFLSSLNVFRGANATPNAGGFLTTGVLKDGMFGAPSPECGKDWNLIKSQVDISALDKSAVWALYSKSTFGFSLLV